MDSISAESDRRWRRPQGDILFGSPALPLYQIELPLTDGLRLTCLGSQANSRRQWRESWGRESWGRESKGAGGKGAGVGCYVDRHQYQYTS